jgi:hypothetical protein
MWVRFKDKKMIDGRTYYAGDWADVENALARQWIVSGLAVVANLEKAMPIGGEAGIVVIGNIDKAKQLRKFYPKLKITTSEWLALSYERTLIWRPNFHFKTELLATGFDLLERWSVAAPLATGDDPTVITYDTNLMFIDRKPDTLRLIEETLSKMENEMDERTAFNKTLREIGITALGLPEVWIRGP